MISRSERFGKNVTRAMLVLTVVFGLAFMGGCASSSGGSEAQAKQWTAPPAGSPLAKVKSGMNDAQVRNLLGNPTNANAYMTGKAWIPFYYGPDTHRSDWMYEGVGRVVFSRNRYSGGLKVVRVIHNPDETGGK